MAMMALTNGKGGRNVAMYLKAPEATRRALLPLPRKARIQTTIVAMAPAVEKANKCKWNFRDIGV